MAPPAAFARYADDVVNGTYDDSETLQRQTDEGKQCRKDMHGITPMIDEHATWAASETRQLRKHLKKFPHIIEIPQYTDGEFPARIKL